MDTFLYLGLGLVLGIALGWLLRSARKTSGNGAEVALAAASARADELQKRIEQFEQENRERISREAEESKLMVELAPVKENLNQMRERVEAMERERNTQFTTLTEAIKGTLASDEALRKQTQMLSSALSSNTVRGVWGEAQLRKLVELAGLVKHADFVEQKTNSQGRTDLVINLPGGNKTLVIDSKVPFNSYQEASAISELETGPEGDRRKQLLKEHVKAVKKHIDDLAGKEYWNGLPANPDFVVCFMPSESLLSAALNEDPTLLEYAFSKNVAIASPVSLFSVLKTINYIWRQNVDENQLRAMLKIGRELYERVGTVVDKVDKLGRSLSSTVTAYNGFVSSLESRMLVTARKLNNLDDSELETSTIAGPAELESKVNLPTAAELTSDEEGETR
ncbi:MAG: hypothetical protein RLZZ400_795 [Actinomycetota bacterium]|jgi:DNA recombination protein RmuC